MSAFCSARAGAGAAATYRLGYFSQHGNIRLLIVQPCELRKRPVVQLTGRIGRLAAPSPNITGVLPGGEQIPLFRLRYGGSAAHSFGFAIYSPAHDRYEDAVLLTGLPIGSPHEALDTACTVHLAALGHEPES